jgi:hypothetical protein
MADETYFTDGRRTGDDSFVTALDTPRRGISWPAIFAGAVAALMLMLVLNLVAVGIGLTSFSLTGDTPEAGNVAGSVGWTVIIIDLIAVAFGGWLAGRVASGYRLSGGFLHGLLSWALITLASFWLLGSAAGSVISGLGSAISSGLNLAASGISALAPAASSAVEQATGDLDLNLEGVRDDLMALLTGEPAAAPAGAVQPAAPAASPALEQAQVRTLLNGLFASGEEPFSAANQERMVALLVERSNLSEAQAQELVSGWAQDYERVQQAIDNAQAEVTAAADDARVVLSRVALLGALGLVIGALLAGWMGTVGARSRRVGLTG